MLGCSARQRGWWDAPEYRAHLTPAMIESLQFEIEASAIRNFQPSLIPGLLQTRKYATAVLADLGTDLAEAVRTTRLEVRLRRRQQLLDRPDPPEHLLVLDESVLLREVGGARATSEQLFDLLDQVRAGRVTVRVSPLASGAGYAQLDLFAIYDTDDKDVALLYREGRRTDEAEYDQAVIQRHRQLCSAYRLNPSFNRSRESNSPTPCSTRNSIHSLTARAYASQLFDDGAPLAGSSRNHRFTATVGRGAPGPSSNRRSPSTKTGIRSGISGRRSTSHDSQP